jgi:hypothetical protein
VALIPPVSGGSHALESRPQLGADLLVPAAVVAVLVLANLADGSGVVAGGGRRAVTAWVVDVDRGADRVAVESSRSCRPWWRCSQPWSAVWTLGGIGMGIGLAAAVILPLGWGVASDSSSMVQILGPSILLTFVACMAIGSLVVTARMSPSTRIIGVYLAIMAVTVVATDVIDRIQHLPVGDPFTLSAMVAVITALVAAAVWDLDLVTFLIVGLVTAVSLVAGRGLGSLLRTSQIVLIERPPGYAVGARRDDPRRCPLLCRCCDWRRERQNERPILTPAHAATTPITSGPTTIATRRPGRSKLSTASMAHAEKVVNPPNRPVPSASRSVASPCLVDHHPTSNPSASDPTTLTVAVPSAGHRELIGAAIT